MHFRLSQYIISDVKIFFIDLGFNIQYVKLPMKMIWTQNSGCIYNNISSCPGNRMSLSSISLSHINSSEHFQQTSHNLIIIFLNISNKDCPTNNISGYKCSSQAFPAFSRLRNTKKEWGLEFRPFVFVFGSLTHTHLGVRRKW